MKDNLLIGQISDAHILGDELLFQDIDVCSHFIKAVSDMKARHVDLVVLSGDQAANNGEVQAYNWIRKVMDDSGLPYVVMMGNHDLLKPMKEAFSVILDEDIQDNLLYFKREIKGKKLYFLDSGNFYVEDVQWRWLNEELKTLGVEEEALLFVHHPLVKVGHKFMDSKFPLRNMTQSALELSTITNIKHICCGHYHFNKSIEIEGKHHHVSPSSFMRIDPNCEKFILEEANASWSYIDWTDERISVKACFFED